MGRLGGKFRRASSFCIGSSIEFSILYSCMSFEPKNVRRRVLVADDSVTIQKLVNITLAGDFDVITALDGFDASLKVRRMKPDVVLVDSQLRERTGEQLLKEIRDDSSLHAVKVVILGTGAEPETQPGLAELADALLVKPFDSQALMSAINGVMRATVETMTPAEGFAQKSFHHDFESVAPDFEEEEETLIRPAPVSDEKPREQKEVNAPAGPFSAFREAEINQQELVNPADRLAAIADEVGLSGAVDENLPPADWSERPTEIMERPSEDFLDEAIELANRSLHIEPGSTPMSIDPAVVERVARDAVEKWINENLHGLVEERLKKEFAKMSQES